MPPPGLPYMPPQPPPKAPRPPFGSQISIDAQGNLSVGALWQKWTRPVSQCTVQTLDQTGQRVTVTRALTIGLFALGAKKKTGHVTVIVATQAGETKTHKVPANFAEQTLAWAVAFNLWHQAVYGF